MKPLQKGEHVDLNDVTIRRDDRSDDFYLVTAARPYAQTGECTIELDAAEIKSLALAAGFFVVEPKHRATRR